MKTLLLIVSVLLATTISHAQDQSKVDSLNNELQKFEAKKKALGSKATAMMDTTKADIFHELSWVYRQIDTVKELSYANQGLKLSESIGYKRGISNGYNDIGNYYYVLRDFKTAMYYYDSCLKIRLAIKDLMGLGGIYNNIGLVYVAKEEYPEALRYFILSMKYNEMVGYKLMIAATLHNVGGIYHNMGNYKLAIENYRKAEQINKETDNKRFLANNYMGLGTTYIAMKQYPEALASTNQARQLFTELKMKGARILMTHRFANILRMQENYPEALKYFGESRVMAEENNNKDILAGTLTNMSKIYEAQGKLDWALDSAKNGLVFALQSQSRAHINNAYKQLTSVYAKLNRFEEAWHSNIKALEYDDPVITAENNRETAKKLTELLMQTTFDKKQDSTQAEQTKKDALAIAEIEKQQLKNELLKKQYDDSLAQKENEKHISDLRMKFTFDKSQDSTQAEQLKKEAVANKELQRQKLVRNGFIGGFGVVLLFSILIMRQRNKVKREKLNVEREKLNVEFEKERSDSLLLNILPSEVAEELKSKGTADAKHFDNVTVLFTDFKSFTKVSEQLSPQELVDELHACFKGFDEICTKYSIEKIKTIGDAYLAVCGLPLADEKHAKNVVNAALEIREFMKNRSKELGAKTFEIRIGINSGSVVAGIVGVKKFAYDIWGDTVNTAARMEQNSEAGKINISETTYALVMNQFECEYRGEIDAKNKGKLKMYFVEKEC
ncbi:MAG: tetratricopeptide repeat protein [Ignavibacteria bacterium]|nr:tetratricopeptide repeat protein [Ignavibacteria bacterium]